MSKTQNKENDSKIAYEKSKCKRKYLHNGRLNDCSTSYSCCSCGNHNCGCAYCFDCNACEYCKNEN